MSELEDKNKKLILAITTHDGPAFNVRSSGAAIYERNLTFWRHHEAKTVTYIAPNFSYRYTNWKPAGALGELHTMPENCFGHHGIRCILRARYVLTDMLKRPHWSWLLSCEQDSFCLEPDVLDLHLDKTKWWGIKHTVSETTRYLLSPYMIHRDLADRLMCAIGKTTGNDIETGDAWIVEVLRRSGIPMSDFGKLGWRCNKTGALTESNRAQMERAVHKGAVFIHGVKTPEGLDWVQHAWVARKGEPCPITMS
jgi:hypothetical protein